MMNTYCADPKKRGKLLSDNLIAPWKYATRCIRFAAGLSLITSVMPFAAPSIFAQSVVEDNQELNRLLASRNYADAIALIQQIGAEGKASKQTYLILASIYLEQGAGIAAETAVDRAKALGASYAETAVPYAKAFLVQGSYAKAIEILSGAEVAENQQNDALIIMADANFAEGRFDAARRIYEQANARFPEDFSAYLGLARLDLRDRNLDRAAEYLKLAEQKAPENTMVQYTSGLTKLYQGDKAGAEIYFLRAIELFPGNLLANIELASLNISRMDYAKAEDYLDRVYEGTPNHPVALYMSALIAAQNGEYKLADNLLGRTRRLTERFLPAIYLRGIVAYALGEYSQAIYVLERGLDALPTGVEIRTLLAASYLRSERYGEAFAVIEPVIKSRDRTNNHLLLAGAALIGLGESEQAKTYFEQAQFDGAPIGEDIEKQIKLNSILSGYVLEQNSQSISAFEQAVTNQKNDLQNLGILASMQMRAEDYENARQTIQKILDIAPERAFGQNMLGNLNYRMGKHAEAILAYDEALTLNAAYGVALKNRALANLALGNFAAVEGDIRAFIRDNPSDMRALAILAKAILEQNIADKLDEALSIFATVSKEFPRDAGLAIDYARALDRSGNRARGISLLRSVARTVTQMEKLGNLGEQLLNMDAFAPAAGILSRYRVSGIDPLRANILYGRALLHSGLHAGAKNAFERAISLTEDVILSGQLEWYEFAASLNDLERGALDEKLVSLDYDKLPSDLSLALIGRAYEVKGDVNSAIKTYASILDRSDDAWDPDVVLSLIRAYQNRAQADDSDKAIELATSFINGNPENMPVRSLLAILFLDQEQFESSIPHLEAMIRAGNTSATTLARIARAYHETGNGEALIFSDRARLINPNDPYVLDVYGWILLQVERRIEEAVTAFEAALKRAPDNAQIRYHYAMALLASGDQNFALDQLEKALESSQYFHGRIEAERQAAILR
jgi:putative PEP-CTERM system TPR-repeat lipoprotein